MTNLHEWECPKCHAKIWSRSKDDRGKKFIFRSIIYKTCRVLMRGIGVTQQRYSLKDLL